MNRRATIELVLAVVAAIGAVACWLAASSAEIAAPVIASEPAKATTAYDPSLVVLAVLLITIAGVGAVLGVTHLRRG